MIKKGQQKVLRDLIMEQLIPKVSVIIASYKQRESILAALQSVYQQRCFFPFEVIVVDSSGDDTGEYIKQHYPQTRVIILQKRAYPGTARNEGIKVAKGEILAFTDTDCIADRNWLQELVKSHDLGYPVVGGLVQNGTPWSILGTLDYLLEFSDLMTPQITTKKDHFATCNVSFRHEIVDRYGYFADQVKGSDNVYFRQMYAAGQVLFWQPKAIVRHHNRRQFKKILSNQYDLGVGSAMNRKKYPLRGKIFAEKPFLIPLLPLVRSIAIGSRLLRNSPLNFIKYLLLLPLVWVCLSSYAFGFYKGLKS